MSTQDIDRYRIAERRLWDHYGVTPTEHFIHLEKYNIRVRVLEIGTGEPVLFVHGSPNAGSKWAPLASKLTDFRCLILDRPGCGLSDPVDYSNIDLREFGADLLGMTLDGLGLPASSVVASSLGGALAFYFAQANPERVVRLVQEGCPAFVEGFRIPIYNIAWSVMSMIFGAAPSSQAAFRHIGHAASIDRRQFESEVLVWRDALLKLTDTTRHENSLSRTISSRLKKYRYGAEFLGQIPSPTLYLWGSSDPFGGTEIGRKSAAAQPNAILKSFPSSGHLPWLDYPATHAHLVRAFLRGEQV
jgi:pimeloyl-ACP methyl ester carboxylesterase